MKDLFWFNEVQYVEDILGESYDLQLIDIWLCLVVPMESPVVPRLGDNTEPGGDWANTNMS